MLRTASCGFELLQNQSNGSLLSSRQMTTSLAMQPCPCSNWHKCSLPISVGLSARMITAGSDTQDMQIGELLHHIFNAYASGKWVQCQNAVSKAGGAYKACWAMLKCMQVGSFQMEVMDAPKIRYTEKALCLTHCFLNAHVGWLKRVDCQPFPEHLICPACEHRS